MDHALPMQVRLAVVSLRDEGYTYEEIASLLGVGRASVSRLLRRQRETGKLDRLRRGGGVVSPIHGRIADLLCRIVGEMNDATLDELTKALIERAGIKTAAPGSCARWRGWGLLKKKSLVAVERDTPEHRERRALFCAFITAVNASRARLHRRVVLQRRDAADTRMGTAR